MIEQTKYLIVGAGHAGLEALRAIRSKDNEGSVVMIASDMSLPYSPTVLPYVASGEITAQQAFLCDEAYFKENSVRFLPGEFLQELDPEGCLASLNSGLRLHYQKLLLATGSKPVIPLIDGLARVPYKLLLTLQDAKNLYKAKSQSRRALILGGGTIGMRVAENLACEGISVTVVELQAKVLSDYFDHEAATLIEDLFARNGVSIISRQRVVSISCQNNVYEITLEDSRRLQADLLLICTGSQPTIDYIAGTAIALDRGILVDERLRTNIDNIWAAGGCIQAHNFLNRKQNLHHTLFDAIEQGRIAGMNMAGIQRGKPYRGGMPLYSCEFFDCPVVSVGDTDETGCEIHHLSDGRIRRYLKILLRNNHLVGMFAIGLQVDGSVMREFILRNIDLGSSKKQFLDRGRALFSAAL